MSTAAIAYDEAVHIPADVRDLDSFRRWVHSEDFPDRAQITYANGEIIIDTAPVETWNHGLVRRDLVGNIGRFCRDREIGEILSGVMLVNDTVGVATFPDMLFNSWDSLRTKRVLYREWIPGSGEFVEVAGSPDMVLEVVSRNSVRKDTQTLRTAYFEAGIQEYWLIDARGREIDFQLLTRGDKEYIPAEPDADGFRSSTVFNAAFRLTRGTNPVGGVRYHLDIHPPTR